MTANTHSRLDEQQFIRAAQTGDKNAFGQLYSANIERVFRYIQKRVGNEMLAEDLASDVFIHALTSIHRYRDSGRPFIAWLYTIARSRIADYYRRLNRDPDIIHLDDVYVAVLPNLDTRLMEQELAQYMHKVIIALTEDQQQVVILRFAEERSVKEVAQIMNKRPNAIKQLQYRALRRMESGLMRTNWRIKG